MLIVLGIIGIMSSVVVAQYRNFDSSTVLSNLAYEVAMSVREAQILSVSASGAGGNPNFPYGINFSKGASQYRLFVDRGTPATQDNKYTGASESIRLVSVTQGASIKDIFICSSTCDPIDEINITYDRPHLDTTFANSSGTVLDLQSVRIVLTSRRGGERTVVIDKSSRIDVLNN